MNMNTKEQSLGYMIIAAKDIGLDEMTMKKLVLQMSQGMDIWTEEYAEQIYDEF